MLKKADLLVLNSSRGYLLNDVKKELLEVKTDLVIFARGLTPILQPLVVLVNTPFKGNTRQVYGD